MLTDLELFNVSQWLQANRLVVNIAKIVALIIAPKLDLSVPSANNNSPIDFTFYNEMIQSST